MYDFGLQTFDKPFLKVYLQKDECHSLMEERASNVLKNFSVMPKAVLDRDPFFNRNLINEEVFDIDLNLQDMEDL
jgi:hypothetical protein